MKKEHDQLLKKVYHETFLLYQEGQIEEISTNIIPKLVEIGDSSFIASIASDFSKCDINALTMAFINSKPFLKKSSKIYDLFTFVTEENIDKINFNYIVSTIVSCPFEDLFFEIRLALDFPYRNINVEDMFSNIIKSDYSIYFKFYLLKDLDFNRYRFFLNSLKNEKNISFLETFTSVDTIIQNSVNNSKSDIFYEMQILQDEVLSSINTSYITDVSKCTLQMILQKINKFYIDYMSYYSDECFKVIRKNR